MGKRLLLVRRNSNHSNCGRLLILKCQWHLGLLCRDTLQNVLCKRWEEKVKGMLVWTCLNCVFSIGFVTEYWLPIWNATSNILKTLWTSHFRLRLQVIHLFEEPLGKTQRRSTRLLWLTRESTDYQQNQQIVLVLCLHWVRTAFSSHLLSKVFLL